MAKIAPGLVQQAGQSYGYPQGTFGKREQQLLLSVLQYVGANSAATITAAIRRTTAGGSAAEAISIPGLLTTDIVTVQMVNNGTNDVTIISASAAASTLTVTFSGNPGSDTVINILVARPNA